MGYKIVTEFDEPPIARMVGPGGDSGRVYVPKAMIGKTVVIAVLPDKEQKAKREE